MRPISPPVCPRHSISVGLRPICLPVFERLNRADLPLGFILFRPFIMFFVLLVIVNALLCSEDVWCVIFFFSLSLSVVWKDYVSERNFYSVLSFNIYSHSLQLDLSYFSYFPSGIPLSDLPPLHHPFIHPPPTLFPFAAYPPTHPPA